MSFIEDGAGTGYKMKVNNQNKGTVLADTEKKYAEISERTERCFVYASGDFISLTTTDTETGILHVKNTSELTLRIESIRSCANVINLWKLYRNSTGGTLITDANTATSSNLNISSPVTVSADYFKGADSKTVSGGTMIEHWVNDVGHSTEIFDGALILNKNDSIQLSVEVPSAGKVCCRITGYYE